MLAISILTYAQAPTLTRSQVDSLDALRIRYIEKYKDVAQYEMARSGIPASIKLAQAIHESFSGTSALARRANNHFGMKCGGDWKGEIIYKNDDDFDNEGQPLMSCFRSFPDPVESYRVHSDFLLDPQKHNRYGFLFQMVGADYYRWARGLQEAGYSTTNHYSARIIEMIERYRLYTLDAWRAPSVQQRIFTTNGVKCLLAGELETLAVLAASLGLDPNKLAVYNERKYAINETLPRGVRIYLQAKAAQWQGSVVHHIAAEGQTMFEISQVYGIRLDELLRRNGLRAGDEPAAGARVRLRGNRTADEKITVRAKGLVIPHASTLILSAAPGEPINTLPMNWANNRELTRVLSKPPVPPQVETVPTFHTVNTGDTLYGIARQYGLTAEALAQMNGITNNVIKQGQVLRVR